MTGKDASTDASTDWQPPARTSRPPNVLRGAAQEFERRAELPGYPPWERERIRKCAQWLRDMAADCVA